MSLLSDRDINREIANGGLRIEPYNASGQLQPASYDCLLGDELLIANTEVMYVDPLTGGCGPFELREPAEEGALTAEQERERYAPWLRVDLQQHRVPLYPWYQGSRHQQGHEQRAPGFWLAPGQFVLGSTVESFVLPDYLSARIEGKSSLGRWGLSVHVTAGFVDPGFRGQLTLEIKNVGPFMLLLRPGMAICQVSFTLMTSAVERAYGSAGLSSKYQGQTGVQAAK